MATCNLVVARPLIATVHARADHVISFDMHAASILEMMILLFNTEKRSWWPANLNIHQLTDRLTCSPSTTLYIRIVMQDGNGRQIPSST